MSIHSSIFFSEEADKFTQNSVPNIICTLLIPATLNLLTVFCSLRPLSKFMSLKLFLKFYVAVVMYDF